MRRGAPRHAKAARRPGDARDRERWSTYVTPIRVSYRTAAALAVMLCSPPAAALRAQTAPAVSADAPVAVTLVDAGTAPRRTLRYTLVPGSTQLVSMRLGIVMEGPVQDVELPPDTMPTTLMTTRIRVRDVAADGTADVQVEIVDIGIDTTGVEPEVVAEVRVSMDSLRGVILTHRVSPDGRVSDLTLATPAPRSFQPAQGLGSTEQYGVVLPAEPVGVGARWTVARDVLHNGVRLTQSTEYVVRSMHADSVVLTITQSQQATDQRMNLPSLPRGAVANMRRYDGRAEGIVALHLRRVQPSVSLTMQLQTEMELALRQQTIEQMTTLRTTLTTGSPPE